MPLLDVLKHSPQSVESMKIAQILAISGSGTLSDNSECSHELRSYFAQVSVSKISEYIEACLNAKANKLESGGFILQDLVNELGRRLDYKVQNGLYQGRINQIGFDGLWEDGAGNALVIEVKTTDAYRINLDTLADYRKELFRSGRVSENCSILILVGRQDTGDLEAQIRGSRHAWDVRVISIDALLDLVGIKQKSDADQTTYKIQKLLLPVEYTRLDNLIDILLTTTNDVESTIGDLSNIGDSEEIEKALYKQIRTPIQIADEVRDIALKALSQKMEMPFVAHKRTQAWSADKKTRVVCSFSKKYENGDFWYAFHPHQLNFLEDGETGILLLSCLDHEFAYSIPLDFLKPLLPSIGMTDNETRRYWHVYISVSKNGNEAELKLKGGEGVSLKKFRVLV